MVSNYLFYCQKCSHSKVVKDIDDISPYVGKLVCSNCKSHAVTIQKEDSSNTQNLSQRETDLLFIQKTNKSASNHSYLDQGAEKSNDNLSEGIKNDDWDADDWESHISEKPDEYFEKL
jgi:recombinational DNA repair protein (RecF pathway)